MEPKNRLCILAGKIVLGMLLLVSVENVAADEEVVSLLKNGRYKEVVALDMKDGSWAFARYFLVPDKKVYEAALRSSKSGDLVGKFVLLKCHEAGIGVRRSESARWKLNEELRLAILAKPERPPLESYILSHLSMADSKGMIDSTKLEEPDRPDKLAGKTRVEHLQDSAEGGMAQAMDELGHEAQVENFEEALVWYRKAAELGLASAMKNLGYMLALAEKEKDRKLAEAVEWTRKGAEGGEVFAMINMDAFRERLHLEEISSKEAQKWIRHSSEMGHPFGQIEHGLALLKPGDGFEKDKEKGMALLQAAAHSGHSTTLNQIAKLYIRGLGVDKDLKLAAKFAKAAWIQGEISAAGVIAYTYREDVDLAKDEAAVSYWNTHAAGKGLAFAMGIDKGNPEIMKELENIDPFSLVVE